MLSLLNKKGPTTEGIFIVPPDISLLETLKEKFDSGEEIDINNQSVHDVAWMLKVGKVLASSTPRIPLSLCE